MNAVQLALFEAASERATGPHYPSAPGFKARGPSEDAARTIAGSASKLRAQVLAELRRWPDGRTADELARLLQRDRLSIRPRLSELRADGKIRATNERRRNESGMTATVWRAAP